MIDTHAHMYSEQFLKDQSEAIRRARDKGVDYILLPNIDVDSIDAMHKLVKLVIYMS